MMGHRFTIQEMGLTNRQLGARDTEILYKILGPFSSSCKSNVLNTYIEEFIMLSEFPSYNFCDNCHAPQYMDYISIALLKETVKKHLHPISPQLMMMMIMMMTIYQ